MNNTDDDGGVNGLKGRLIGMRGGCINCSIPAMDAIRYCIKHMIMYGMAICVGRAGVAINQAVTCR